VLAALQDGLNLRFGKRTTDDRVNIVWGFAGGVNARLGWLRRKIAIRTRFRRAWDGFFEL
jgi:hypothetical protein